MSESQASDAVKQAEHSHLGQVQQRLTRALQDIDQRLQYYRDDIQAQKEYLWGNRSEMDHIEKIASRESIQQMVTSGDALLERRRRLERLQATPYFGRFDFNAEGQDTTKAIYLGIHHFQDNHDGSNVIHDWRAPIATLFYDFEGGQVSYVSPEGEVHGVLSLKRQFRIRGGELEFMIESAVHVVDDVLQETLSRASDDSMRNIVATIQRDQNAIIRNDESNVLIIQGVAGSGKTSIALHRIAYLLYRYKDTLSSEDILIVSPNRVFADYISNVLPELGEESVNEIGMETLANELLGGEYRFQSFFEQTADVLERGDESMRERLRYKASPEFLEKLREYAAWVERQRFVAEDVWISKRLMPGWVLDEIYRKHRSLASKERISQVVTEAQQKIANQYNYVLLPEERKHLRDAVSSMLRQSTLRKTYKQFFEWLGKPELFRQARRGALEYADVFPLIYLKMRLEGLRSPYRAVKHLLIDEMQDYSAVQYAVIAKLFNCRMTILGDANQSVNPYSASNASTIAKAFNGASCVRLNKSFRSSLQITRFTQRIMPNPDLEAMERHGEEPQIIACTSQRKEAETLQRLIGEFLEDDANTLAIICKTQKQATRLHAALPDDIGNTQLLNEQSRSFAKGVIVCTAHMAKGLEFDQVIVPQVTETNYQTDMDRHLLYVACTRAMHRLTLTHTGLPSLFVEA